MGNKSIGGMCEKIENRVVVEGKASQPAVDDQGLGDGGVFSAAKFPTPLFSLSIVPSRPHCSCGGGGERKGVVHGVFGVFFFLRVLWGFFLTGVHA